MTEGRKRRVWTDDEKRTICAQTRMIGVSASQVARRCDVNANLVFKWRKDPRFGVGNPTEAAACFLPVEVVDQHAGREPVPAVGNRIEIDLAGSHSLRITGRYDPEALARLILGLSA